MTVVLAFALLALAGIANLTGAIWTLVQAFRIHARWGILLLAPPFVSGILGALGGWPLALLGDLAGLGIYITFLVKHWPQAKQPFFVMLGGLGAAVLAGVLGFSAAKEQFQQKFLAQAPAITSLANPPLVERARPAIAATEPQPADASVRPPPPVLLAPPPVVTTAAAELAEPTVTPSKATVPTPESFDLTHAPLVIRCTKYHYESHDSLQEASLTLSNASPKAIVAMRIRLVYLDGRGEKLKEWTTERELNEPLPPHESIELSQPAYFLSYLTKRVEVESRSVRFVDGTRWAPKTFQAFHSQ